MTLSAILRRLGLLGAIAVFMLVLTAGLGAVFAQQLTSSPLPGGGSAAAASAVALDPFWAAVNSWLQDFLGIVLAGAFAYVAKVLGQHVPELNGALQNINYGQAGSRFAARLIDQLQSKGLEPHSLDIGSPEVASYAQKMIAAFPQAVAAGKLTPDDAAHFVFAEMHKLLAAGGLSVPAAPVAPVAPAVAPASAAPVAPVAPAPVSDVPTPPAAS